MSPQSQEAMRLLCGLWLLPHAVLKVKNAELAQHSFAQIGLRPGKAFLYLTVLMEVLAAAGLSLDFHPRLAALLAVAVLVGASYSVWRTNGFAWRWNKLGVEYMLFWSIATILAVA